MPVFKGESFQDRQSAVVAAKKQLLEKFKARPGPDDPAVQAREAERRAVAEARAGRAAEREAARKAREAEEAARSAADDAARLEARRQDELVRLEQARLEAELATIAKAEAAARKTPPRRPAVRGRSLPARSAILRTTWHGRGPERPTPETGTRGSERGPEGPPWWT